METSNRVNPVGRNNSHSGNQSFAVLESIITDSTDLKNKFADIMDSELLEESVLQIKRAGGYVKSHWKIIVPVLAAVGIGSFFLIRRAGKMDSDMSNEPDSDELRHESQEGWTQPSRQSPPKKVSTPTNRTNRRH
jgi:hypothetical protein